MKGMAVFTCACGEKVQARSHRGYDIYFNPIVAMLWFLLSLSMVLLLDWLIMEILHHYSLQHIHEMLATGRWWILYTLGPMIISGWFVFNIISVERQRQDHLNGVSVFYGCCKKCRCRRRFVRHTEVTPQPWFQLHCYDDNEYSVQE